MKTILIADDHHLICDAFMDLIQFLQPGSRILTSTTAKQVDEYIEVEKNIGHIFLDLTLLDTKGLDYAIRLCTKIPPEKICVVSGESSSIIIKTCQKLKISGFIPKTLSSDGLLAALKSILEGKMYYPESTQCSKSKLINNEGSISKRQLEVLILVAQGLANKEIAQQLNLSNETVKIHIRNILSILNAPSRTAAVTIARNQGLI